MDLPTLQGVILVYNGPTNASGQNQAVVSLLMRSAKSYSANISTIKRQQTSNLIR
jgi:hypothetical protein